MLLAIFDETVRGCDQKWLRACTDIKNLYLTGQDILTVGVTSALFSGLLTASAILNKNLLREILKD
jgi:all-trans-retinol 13,14-reductase